MAYNLNGELYVESKEAAKMLFVLKWGDWVDD